jgi:hypothetical protein
MHHPVPEWNHALAGYPDPAVLPRLQRDAGLPHTSWWLAPLWCLRNRDPFHHKNGSGDPNLRYDGCIVANAEPVITYKPLLLHEISQ